VGRTPKPLTILVHPSLEQLEAVCELRDKGHWISTSPVSREGSPLGIWEFDLVLGPTAWRMTNLLAQYIKSAVRAAWAIKYPKEPEL